MPVQYLGDPTAAQPPSPVPDTDEVPIMNLPVDGVDPPSADSIAQPLKVAADWLAFLCAAVNQFQGIRRWMSTVAYGPSNWVIGSDNHVYRSLASPNLNFNPVSNPAKWGRVDWQWEELRPLAKFTEDLTPPACTNGASVSGGVTMLSFDSGARKQLTFVVNNVPANGHTDVDLSALTTKLVGYSVSVQVSMNSGGESYGGQVGGSGGAGASVNLFRLWFKKGAGDAATAASVSVTVVGY